MEWKHQPTTATPRPRSSIDLSTLPSFSLFLSLSLSRRRSLLLPSVIRLWGFCTHHHTPPLHRLRQHHHHQRSQPTPHYQRRLLLVRLFVRQLHRLSMYYYCYCYFTSQLLHLHQILALYPRVLDVDRLAHVVVARRGHDDARRAWKEARYKCDKKKQNWIRSEARLPDGKIAPPRPPPWCNPRKGRDQILQRSVAEP